MRTEASDARRLVIVLIDDDDTFRTALAEALREDGYCVRDYGAPGEVPPLPELSDVAVVITDYEMPGETGLDFAKRFHALYPTVPVIMVTGYDGACVKNEATRMEFLSLCGKPVDYDELLRVVTRQIGDGAEVEYTATVSR